MIPSRNGIRVVDTFDQLVSTPFADGINALCWRRDLRGDFGAVVEALRPGDGITPVDDATLAGLALGPAGRSAVEVLREDLRRLGAAGRSPVLECVRGYERDEGPVPTDVYSFHVDSATVEADTWLCTYHGPAAEGLDNDEAVRVVDVAQTRAELLKLFGGNDDGDFHAWLHEHHFDLHYAALPGALPFSFGVGNLWRIAVQHPGSRVPPCIHRAPGEPVGLPRLLLIS